MADIAYHSLVEGAMDRWHRIIISAVIISGTAAFASLAKVFPVGLQSVFLLLIVGAGTLDIVFDPPGVARAHRDIRNRLHALLAQLEISDHSRLAAIRAELQEIYAQQPPSNRFVQAVAYNVAVDAMYPRDQASRHYEQVPRKGMNPLTWLIKVDAAYAA
jgi:hypothetical protein